MNLQGARALLEQSVGTNTKAEREAAANVIAANAKDPEELLFFLGALGLDDDADIIGQPIEPGVSDAATGPLTSSLGSDKVMP